ncbi:MAG: DUF6364 family protein [Bacteroidia bacterium]|jgi:hypothetical protein
MATKLTLTVDKDIIDRAKVFAGKTGRSLSEIIETYLRALVHKEKDPAELSPRVKQLMGSVKAPRRFDYKRELEKSLAKKYGA